MRFVVYYVWSLFNYSDGEIFQLFSFNNWKKHRKMRPKSNFYSPGSNNYSSVGILSERNFLLLHLNPCN
jgi:hypothetical protein